MNKTKMSLGLAAVGLTLSGCFFNDNTNVAVPTVPDVLAFLGGGGAETFNNPVTERKYGVLKVGMDTSAGTLKLGITDSTFPFIWIANSGEGTISKLDVTTGKELGRYMTGPGNGNPSRTTVDQDGNVWVGNRNNNTITKVGLKEFGQCIDRNGNGVIDTSTPVEAAGEVPFNPDVKDWDGTFGDGQGITNAMDECILLHVALIGNEAEVPTPSVAIRTPSDIRTVAIDPDNNVFVGGYYQNSLFKVNGTTGVVIKSMATQQPHYGGVVDKNGNLWSMSSGSGKVQKTDKDMTTNTLIDIGHDGYGIGIDKYGKIWTTEYGARFSTFDPADPVGTLKVFTQTGSSAAQGIASDDNGDIFIAGSLSGRTVGHYKQVFTEGVFSGVTFVTNYPVGNPGYEGNTAPTGVAVDGFGRVWSANQNTNDASRITLAADPANAVIDSFAVGSSPYNYSDMTGRVVRTITNRQGTWEATFDGGKPDYIWQRVLWKLKQALPAGTTVSAYAKSANSEIELGAKDYAEVLNDTNLAGIQGRFLKLKVRLTSATPDKTPEITEISLK